jgi:hypothetical protein
LTRFHSLRSYHRGSIRGSWRPVPGATRAASARGSPGRSGSTPPAAAARRQRSRRAPLGRFWSKGIGHVLLIPMGDATGRLTPGATRSGHRPGGPRMPATSEEAPERQPRNPGCTPASPPLRTSHYCGCREGFQNLAMVFFLIPGLAAGGGFQDGACGCAAPVTSATLGRGHGRPAREGLHPLRNRDDQAQADRDEPARPSRVTRQH